MTPGELATLFALLKARLPEVSGLHSIFIRPANKRSAERPAFLVAWRALVSANWYSARTQRERGAAIDRAIIEAEALEDMGATEVLP